MRPILLLCTLVLLSVGMADAQERRYTQGVLTDNTTIVTSEETQMVRVRVPRERRQLANQVDMATKKWELGVRGGFSSQLTCQYLYKIDRMFETRLGVNLSGALDYNLIMVDVTLLHNWRYTLKDTSRGRWFFDTGVGFNVGGLDGVFTCGAVGMMRIGHQFYESPITIALDWSPSIGFNHDWAYNISSSSNSTVFNVVGLANFGLNFSVSF